MDPAKPSWLLRNGNALFVGTTARMACAAASARDAWLEKGGLFVTANYIGDESLRPSNS